MPDKFERYKTNLESPIANAFAVTPNNSADLATYTRYVMIGGGADLTCEFVDDPVGQSVLLKLTPSVLYPFRLRKIYAAGTTATSIVGMY